MTNGPPGILPVSRWPSPSLPPTPVNLIPGQNLITSIRLVRWCLSCGVLSGGAWVVLTRVCGLNNLFSLKKQVCCRNRMWFIKFTAPWRMEVSLKRGCICNILSRSSIQSMCNRGILNLGRMTLCASIQIISLSLPVEPIVCVSRVREGIVAAEIITGFGILRGEQNKQKHWEAF